MSASSKLEIYIEGNNSIIFPTQEAAFGKEIKNKAGDSGWSVQQDFSDCKEASQNSAKSRSTLESNIIFFL